MKGRKGKDNWIGIVLDDDSAVMNVAAVLSWLSDVVPRESTKEYEAEISIMGRAVQD